MSRIVIDLGTIAIALAGILIVLGARKPGWRVLAVGVILIAAATWLGHAPATHEAAHVAAG
jgi:threonine/homoserine efflux transporter RhtA